MELWVILLRTIFIYALIVLVVHLLDKRRADKLTLIDLIISFMIAHLAANAIADVNTPMLASLIPILHLCVLQVLFLFISSRSHKWRSVLSRHPSLALANLEQVKKEPVTTRSVHYPIILIKDGLLLQENIDKLGKNNFWLKAELKKRIGLTNFKHISFCSIDGSGQWYIDLKDYVPQK